MSMAINEAPADPSRFREAAVDLARKGFYVFRLVENGKVPKDKRFYELASNDPEIVRQRWTDSDGHGERFNIGVLTGTPTANGILHVVDVDTKPGKVGKQSLRDRPWLERDTWTVVTTTGGLHLYYAVPQDGPTFTSGQSRLGPDIDDRGYHGYVVGPGSEINGRSYKLIDDTDIQPANPAMLELLQRKKDTGSLDPTKALVLVDGDSAVRQAISYLQSEDDPPEGKRNARCHIVGAGLKDRGVSLPVALDLAFQYWQFAYNHPEFRDELEKTFTSAYATGTLAPGVKNVEYQFEDLSGVVDEEINAIGSERLTSLEFKPANAKRKSHVQFLPLDQIITSWMDEPPALIDDLLLASRFSVLYGPPGEGKSFVAIDLLMHVALGKPWCDLKVQNGAVCYVVGEGATGAKKRITAAFHRLKLEGQAGAPFYMQPTAVDLYGSDDAANQMIQEIQQLEAQLGVKFTMIVVDTLARSMPGGDENSVKDLGIVIEHVDLIREATGAHIMLVHHTGKDLSKGARGSTALLGAIDTEILVNEGSITVTKQRDLEHKFNGTFTIISTDIGSVDGIQVKSGYVAYKNEVSLPDDFPTGIPTQVMPKGWPSFKRCNAVLDGIEQAWNADTPWSMNRQAHAYGRFAQRNISAQFDIDFRLVGTMLSTWISLGCIETAEKSRISRLKGLKVLDRTKIVHASDKNDDT
jgi:hypothetical protein